ncbi:MAG: F0F1 ATP synthase subunit A [Spirochaetia bacterium]|nr:F0F1 ATP synthase subunit A [Spirochaetia bacterium]
MFKFLVAFAFSLLLFVTTAGAQTGIPAAQQPQTEQGINKQVPSADKIEAAGAESEEHSTETHESSGEFDLNHVINHHLGDVRLWDVNIAGYNFPITKRVVMMWIASLLLLLILIPAARLISRNAIKRPGRFTGIVEVFVNFVRNDVGHSNMGHHSRSYEPFLLTLFFFILFCNLIGLIPSVGEIVITAGDFFGFHFNVEPGDVPLPAKLWSGITPTGDLGVTATLAIYSFIFIQVSGFVYQGVSYIKNIVPAGIPWAIWPIMWPIELLGQVSKPFALAIRLLANMTAGHLLILVFLGFIFQFQLYAIIPVSISVTIAIYMLELFVAFLQAYIFVFLTALFIAGAQHRH